MHIRTKSALLASVGSLDNLTFGPGMVFAAAATIEELQARQQEIQASSEALVSAADEEGRDCGCSKRIMDRIDAALQAAMESTEPKGS